MVMTLMTPGLLMYIEENIRLTVIVIPLSRPLADLQRFFTFKFTPVFLVLFQYSRSQNREYVDKIEQTI